jgi:hypothetical protein
LTTKATTAASESRGKVVKAHGLTLKLPAKLPFTTVKFVKGDDIDIAGFLAAVLGEEQVNKVWDAGLDMDQGTELVEAVLAKYGLDAGE